MQTIKLYANKYNQYQNIQIISENIQKNLIANKHL